MLWKEIRDAYPNQWLVIEALDAHTTPDGHRQLLNIAVIQSCPDGPAALKSYRSLHGKYPLREFYFIHTSHENLDIKERRWIGIRRNRENTNER